MCKCGLFLECTYSLHKDVEGSLRMAVGQVGLPSLLYCNLLPAGVDGFTRLSYFCGVFCSRGAVYPSWGSCCIMVSNI